MNIRPAVAVLAAALGIAPLAQAQAQAPDKMTPPPNWFHLPDQAPAPTESQTRAFAEERSAPTGVRRAAAQLSGN